MFKDYPDIVSIEEVAQMLKIGSGSVYKLLRQGKIKHEKAGSKYIIPKNAVVHFLTQCYTDDDNKR